MESIYLYLRLCIQNLTPSIPNTEDESEEEEEEVKNRPRLGSLFSNMVKEVDVIRILQMKTKKAQMLTKRATMDREKSIKLVEIATREIEQTRRDVKEKKKEVLQEQDIGDDNDDDCDNDDVDVNTPNSRVGNEVDDDDRSTEVEERAQIRSNKLNSLLEDTSNYDGPFWANGTIGSKTDLYMLSAITTYNNINGLHDLRSTPQYEFNRGMKEFGQAGYDATVSELSDNLIGMDTVQMLDKSRITSDVFMNALSYLMFLKRKKTDVVKARGCVDGRPQREFISKEESCSPTVSTYALFILCAMDAMEGR